jgi:cytochrome c biogenesis protein CcmG/thiol:disulfide interchange protein DsbE
MKSIPETNTTAKQTNEREVGPMKNRTKALAAFLAAILIQMTAPAYDAVAQSAKPAVGEKALDFTLQTHDGKSLTLSKLQGKRGAVLVFFATWCPYCMAEVPEIKRFVEATRDKNVLVYGVNLQQDRRTVEKFIESDAINYRILLDTDSAVARKYGVTGIPHVIGIDAAGVVRHRSHALPEDKEAFIKTLTAPLPKAELSLITKETLQKMMADGKPLVVIDVLSPQQYAAAHVKGAINVPGDQIEARAGELSKDARIVVYCASFDCHASTNAAKTLMKLGFTNVSDYKGGIRDWTEAGLPVETGEGT